MTTYKLRRGRILLAEPFMLDPNFRRSVILLCEHEIGGSIGFILNKPLEMTMNELVADFPEFDVPVFYGGPVNTDTVHFLHNAGDLIDNSRKISNGVYWGGDFEQVKELIANEVLEPRDIRFYVGYSGWSFMQLEDELENRSWIVGKMNEQYIFRTKAKKLWKKAMYQQGNALSVIAQMPEIIVAN